jgi:hypothetical protein
MTFTLEPGVIPVEKSPVIQTTRPICLLVTAGSVLLLALAGGCTSTSSVRNSNAAQYAPTDVNRVQLIPWASHRPHETLGEIVVKPAESASWQEIDLELRESAAELGAHAIYIVWDPRKRFSSVQVDPAAADQKDHYSPDSIVAVAIRFK